jgi:hypothetical protein
MKTSNLQSADRQALNLTAEGAVASMESLYAEATQPSNGKPSKDAFFRCLATLKARMGIKPDGIIPEMVFAALTKVAHERGDTHQKRPRETTIAENEHEQPDPAKATRGSKQSLKTKQNSPSRKKSSSHGLDSKRPRSLARIRDARVRKLHFNRLLAIASAAKRHRLYASTSAPSRASTKPNQWVQELGKPKPILNRALR